MEMQRKKTKGLPRPTYRFTPAIDAAIADLYENRTGRHRPEVRRLSERTGISPWAIARRALEIGVRQPMIREAPWSDEEISLLRKNANYSVHVIQRKLRKAGFVRSLDAVALKRKRCRAREQGEPTSANAVAACFGVDPKTVTKWIAKGLLKTRKKGTRRRDAQGGDEHVITPKDIRTFVIDNIGIIDLRKVDKFWFVALLTGRRDEL